MSGARATEFERRRRVDEVYNLLLNRISYAAICRYTSTNWTITARQTDRYIVRAAALIRDDAEGLDHEEALGKAMADYDMIFAKQMAVGNLREARATLDKIVKLLGLAAPRRSEISGPEGGPIAIEDLSTLTDEELAQLAAINDKLDAQ